MFQATGSSLLTYKDATGVAQTQTFSASATGATSEEALKSLNDILFSLVYSYLASIVGYTDVVIETYNLNVTPLVPQPYLELYYNLVLVDGKIINDSEVLYNENPYAGTANICMVNQDGTLNNNYISYLSSRTYPSPNYNLPPLYSETFTILLEDGSLVSGTNLYLDNGDGFVTDKPYEIFQIMSKSGVFEQCNYVKILYDNSDPNLYKRVVQFFS